jgi:aminopeptidase YwaD
MRHRNKASVLFLFKERLSKFGSDEKKTEIFMEFKVWNHHTVMKKTLLTILIIPMFTAVFAQDKSVARSMVDTLASPYFWGRGYTNDGLKKAAAFLSNEFKTYGLQPAHKGSYLQEFSFPVNTFPGKMEVIVNGITLTPGKDFIVTAESKGTKANGSLVKKDSAHFIDAANRIIVSIEKKLTMSVSTEVADYTQIHILKGAVTSEPSSIKVNVENKIINNFKTSNVVGLVKGTEKPDSVIVITAHYDHLGGMGQDTYFPGANDNASGISLLLNLAKHYSQNPQPYTIVFICFSGEEAGLIGSKYFSEHPLIPLEKMRFLINIDLAGTGDEGITVVNASVFSKEFEILKNINKEQNYFTQVKSRGKAANSDHYWFTEKGVHSFFIYALGGIKAYHDVDDRAETLPLTEYDDLFQLIVRFNERIMNR